jgi:Ca-activated chloride channel family protein
VSFQWPELLWGLAVLPLLALYYAWLQRRRKRLALKYANLSLVREAMARGAGGAATCRRCCCSSRSR